MSGRQQVPVEKAIRSARIALFVQSVLSIVGGLFLVALVNAFDSGGADGAGGLFLFAFIAIVLGAVVFTCAVLLPRRLPWVRTTVIVIEAINGIAGIIGLILSLAAGSLQASSIVPIVFSILVLQVLLRSDVKEWFATGETVRS